MPPYCYVSGCKPPPGVSFFNFPKDEILCQLWIEACGRQNYFNTKNARICEKHFIPQDFKRDFCHELLGLPIRKYLQPGVVPTVSVHAQKEHLGHQDEPLQEPPVKRSRLGTADDGMSSLAT